MKFILISDLHISLEQPIGRLDNVAVISFHKLNIVLEYARKINAVVVQAGDFVDKPRSWFLLPMLTSCLMKYKIPIYCVAGQHDVYMYNEETKDNTTLGVLAKAGLVHILNEHPVEIRNVRIYGASHGQEIPVPDDGLVNILVVHEPIAMEWAGVDYIDAEVFLKEHKEYDYILCGDIHRKFLIQKNGRTILNTGPMVRRSATEYNFKHAPGFLF